MNGKLILLVSLLSPLFIQSGDEEKTVTQKKIVACKCSICQHPQKVVAQPKNEKVQQHDEWLVQSPVVLNWALEGGRWSGGPAKL